jgi:3-dehydroquinate synthase
VERVTVPIPGRSYEVVVGAGAIERAAAFLPSVDGADRAFVIADRAVADRWFEPLEAACAERGLKAVPLAIPAGEQAKTLQVYGTLLHQLATQEAHRADLVVSLGGGTAGDLAGFVASTYMRGLPFVQVPTTLTAQVDAAIGGKTAVNLPEGKNLVGTFFQPLVVIADVGALAGLEERDFASGLAEVAKYGLTLDTELLALLETDPGPVLRRDPDVLERVVARCVAAKAATVADDELDTGRRMVLNYGHTLGHAVERLDAFEGRTHGEAIATGMVFAASLAEVLGTCAPGLAARTVRLLSSLGLETGCPLPPVEAILSAFRLDKKFHGSVRFVLLEDVGRPVVVDDVPEARVREVLTEMGAAA